jgi:chromosome segregation ATPase
VINSSAVVDRILLERVGNVASSYSSRGAEDFATWLRISTFTDWLYLPEPLVVYTADSPDSLRKSNEFSQKNMVQRMQISDLTTKLSSLDSVFAQERLDLKKATDDAINSVMVVEQKKYDTLLTESKKALESYVVSKQELEVRCNGYISEINSLRDEHGRHVEQIMNQMNSLENEAKRVRNHNVMLKESTSTITSENSILKRELDDTKKRLLLSLEESEDCHRTLQEAITERQELRSKIDKLGSELEHSIIMRSKEFDLISQTISTTLEKEFQSLKVNLKVKEIKK